MRRLVNWPYWPEVTIVVGWQVLAAPIRSIWQSDLALGALVGLAAYFLVVKSALYKLAMSREFG